MEISTMVSRVNDLRFELLLTENAMQRKDPTSLTDAADCLASIQARLREIEKALRRACEESEG